MADPLQAELRQLRMQMTSDFDFTVKGMQDLSDRLERNAAEMSARLERNAAEMSEGFRQVQGRMRLIEERFGKFLDLIERDRHQLHDRMDDHEQRLLRLEQGPPAA